jgi:hypothetical protein
MAVRSAGHRWARVPLGQREKSGVRAIAQACVRWHRREQGARACVYECLTHACVCVQSNYPQMHNGRTLPGPVDVRAHSPAGDSPFGVSDLVLVGGHAGGRACGQAGGRAGGRGRLRLRVADAVLPLLTDRWATCGSLRTSLWTHTHARRSSRAARTTVPAVRSPRPLSPLSLYPARALVPAARRWLTASSVRACGHTQTPVPCRLRLVLPARAGG